MKKKANIQTGAQYIYCALNENGNRFQKRVTVVEVFDDEVAKVRFEDGMTRPCNIYSCNLYEIGSDRLKKMLINEAKFRQEEWAGMTFFNQHSEVRQVIAMHFGFNKYADYFRSLCSRGYLMPDDVTNRRELTKTMLVKIAYQYSQEIAEQIKAIL